MKPSPTSTSSLATVVILIVVGIIGYSMIQDSGDKSPAIKAVKQAVGAAKKEVSQAVKGAETANQSAPAALPLFKSKAPAVSTSRDCRGQIYIASINYDEINDPAPNPINSIYPDLR